MRKLALIPLLTVFYLSAFGLTEKEVVQEANNLIKIKKYESAFNLLDRYDSANIKADIVLLKEEIVLNYFVKSMMHQMFALKDIDSVEDIYDYRDKEGSFGLFIFQADSIIEQLIKTDPNNCKLYAGLGTYYYETYMHYRGNWLKSDEELFQLMRVNFQKAIDGKCADFMTYYALGFLDIVESKFKESIPYFLKSIEMKADYANSHYNLAYAYVYNEDKENALKYAKNSLDLYTDREYKSDAARMLGQIYVELNDDKKALEYHELAVKIDTANYTNLKPLLDIYVKTNNPKAKAETKLFFDLAPDNPTIYNDLEDIYYKYKKENELIAFYKSELSSIKNEPKAEGSLNFYLGKMYIETDKKIAKEYLLKAKQIFGGIFDADHPVFNAIEEGIKKTEK